MDKILHKLAGAQGDAETKEELVSKARNRSLSAVGLLLCVVTACVVGYVIFSSMNEKTPDSIQDQYQMSTEKPELYICSGEKEPPMEALRRAKRQNGGPPNLLKRVPRPLSLPPPPHGLNFSYNPPLYHDAGARCAWGHIANKRVPGLEDVGLAYDFQQLDARPCDDPEECKSMCLRMHKTDDQYLCNYFTWHRQKKLALFYFLEPTLRWNLTEDSRVETFFWQCRETKCAWWWRPQRVFSSLSELTTKQLRRAPGLITATQCTDFATCQFLCETRPSFKEISTSQQIQESAQADDPSCSYVVMPSRGAQSRESYLFSMPQVDLKNVTYRGSSFYDSFELICQSEEPATPPATTSSSTITTISLGSAPKESAPSQPAQAQPATQESTSAPVTSSSSSSPQESSTTSQTTSQPTQSTSTQAVPDQNSASSNATQKRHLKKRDAPNSVERISMRDCSLNGELVDCSQVEVKDGHSLPQCIPLNPVALNKGASVTLQTKRPAWLVLQYHGSAGDFEQSVQLVPGLRYAIDIASQKMGDSAEDKRCGPSHLRHRRCSTSCNDRLAVDNCGCTLNVDPDPHAAAAMFSLPVCSEEKVRSCVHQTLDQSTDAYFDCMKECKAECNKRKPFTVTNKAISLPANSPKDSVQVDLSLFDPPAKTTTIDTRPVHSASDGHEIVFMWLPIMVVAVVLVAAALCYCAKQLL